jgi:hypothetical protein
VSGVLLGQRLVQLGLGPVPRGRVLVSLALSVAGQDCRLLVGGGGAQVNGVGLNVASRGRLICPPCPLLGLVRTQSGGTDSVGVGDYPASQFLAS